jgi:hypothetical protein
MLAEEHPSHLLFKAKVKHLVAPYVLQATGDVGFDLLSMESVGTPSRPAYLSNFITISGIQSNILLLKQHTLDGEISKDEELWTLIICEIEEGYEKILVTREQKELVVDFSKDNSSVIMESIKLPTFSIFK